MSESQSSLGAHVGPRQVEFGSLAAQANGSQKPKEGKYLPTDPAARKKIPLYSGLIKYFPDALAAVASVSQAGNDQHNPGQPLHWSRGKSNDHHDTLTRHLLESGDIDVDGHRHSAKMAWRALAILQLEIEASKGQGEQSATSKR
jgi:Domain of unknown function (DUF5664)